MRAEAYRPLAAVLVGLAISVVAAQPVAAEAQQTVSIAGRVVDSQSQLPIPGAKVTSQGVETVTDADGRFTLALTRGSVTLEASADGYSPDTTSVNLAPDAATTSVEIFLIRGARFSEQISVRGRITPVEIPPATTPVTPLEVRSVAGAVENVYRVLQTLPGVGATDEIGSRLTVRGGGPDQNLTVMDGVEIHNPYRLFGLFSAFNPETVERFELTAGGFGAKYGDRLSSLLVVENRPGSESRTLGGSFALGLTDTSVVFEGQLPGTAKGSWLFTGRRTYYDLIAARIIDQTLPSFGDLQTTVAWLPRPGQRVTFFAMRSRELTDAIFDEGGSGEGLALKSMAKNDLAALSFFAAVGSKGSSRTIVSWYRNADRIGVDGRLRNNARRSNALGDPLFSNIVFERDLLLRDVAVREELSLTASPRHLVESGVEFHALDTGWSWSITGDRNPSAANGSSVRGGAGLPASLDSSRRATRVGAWVSDRWEIGSRLNVEPGLRFDWSGINREATVSPRLIVSADLTRTLRLRAAAGLYTQSPGYEKLLQSDYFVDLTNADRVKLSTERAWHGVVALDRTLTDSVTMRFEGYVKTFDDLIVGRLETPDEVLARLATYDFPPELSSSLPTDAQITTDPINGAGGRAYGFDVYVSRKAISPSTRLSGWASYTFGRADLDAYGRRYAFDYDRRHAVSVVGMYQVSRLLELAATARVASAFPRTPVLGLHVAAVERVDGGVARLVPERDEHGLFVYTIDIGGVQNLNTARLPPFARLDVRTTFKPGWMSRRWQLYVEIINVLNRKNAGALEPTLEYDPASDRPRVAYRRDIGLPLLPTFGVRYRF